MPRDPVDLGLNGRTISRDYHHKDEWEQAQKLMRAGERRYLPPRQNDEAFLKKTVGDYKYWVNEECSLVFRKGKRFYIRRAAKRGNDKYRQRTWERLNKLFEGLEDEEKYFDYKDRNVINGQSDTFLITLTFPRQDYVGDAWKHTVSKQMNRFNSRIKRLIPGIEFIRGYESHEDGYPHIHIVAILPKPVRVIRINGKMRMITSLRNQIRNRWGTTWNPSKRDYEGEWWNADILALDSRIGGLKYVAKYITKASKAAVTAGNFCDLDPENRKHVLTLALGWLYRKRTFSTTRNLRNALMSRMRISTVSLDPNIRIGGEPPVLIGFLFGKIPDEWYQGWIDPGSTKDVYLHPSFYPTQNSVATEVVSK